MERALASVERQSFRDFEVIVVDDGSTDATASIAAEAYPAARIFRQENLGPGPARNRGMAEARGRYIAFLDSDDLWFPWTLQTYKNAINQHEEPACLFGSVVHFSERDSLPTVPETEMKTQVYPDYLSTVGTDVFQGTGVAVLNLDKAKGNGGFFTERMFCEDLDFFMRMGTAGPIVFVRQPCMVALWAHADGSMSDMTRTHLGTSFLVAQEKRGAYPGGRVRRANRIRLLLGHVNHVLATCLQQGDRAVAWDLYRKTLLWWLSVGEYRFVARTAKQLLWQRLGFVRQGR